jgi:cytoskeletal protein RodZ
MAISFIKKKIKRLTLGERLRFARMRQQISYADAEAATNVRAKYLSAIEKGRWEDLPGEVYVRGFVIAYAKFLELDQDEIMGLFRIEANTRKYTTDDFVYQKKIEKPKFIITPKTLGFAALAAFLFVAFGYIAWQVFAFTGNPELTISTPSNNQILSEDKITVSGLTNGANYLTVNNEKIPVTEEGKFSLDVKLQKGINVIKVTSVNKTQKTTQEVLTVEYKPQTASINSNTN